MASLRSIGLHFEDLVLSPVGMGESEAAKLAWATALHELALKLFDQFTVSDLRSARQVRVHTVARGALRLHLPKQHLRAR